MKRRFQSQKGTAQPCQRGVKVNHEKSLGNCLSDGINVYMYIKMTHDIKIFFFYMKYLMINVDELQVMKLL